MATKNTSTSSGSPSTTEIREWYEKNRDKIERYDKANKSIMTLRDITQSADIKKINTIDKEELKGLIKNVASSEKKLRNTSRYLFYRSNIY